MRRCREHLRRSRRHTETSQHPQNRGNGNKFDITIRKIRPEVLHLKKINKRTCKAYSVSSAVRLLPSRWHV